MKKYLPIAILIIGILVVIGAIIFVARSRNKPKEVVEDEIALIEVSPDDRPVLILTPRSDGHWLDMKVSKLGRFDAMSMDYELLYKLPDGRTQGVPGTVRMDMVSGDEVEYELLLGSESSGNFRYDEGVEDGTLTLRFRNSEGKLLVKFESTFKLQSGVSELTNADGSIIYTLDDEDDTNYFVVMNTIGYPDELPGEVDGEPFGIFGSSQTPVSGIIDIDSLMRWDGSSWEDVTSGESSDIGIFIQTKPL